MSKKKSKITIAKAVHHTLKTDPAQFQALWSGVKTFDIRFNDRHFSVNDTITFLETYFPGEQMRKGDPYILHYTGRRIEARIVRVEYWEGLRSGYAALGLSFDVLAVDERARVGAVIRED